MEHWYSFELNGPKMNVERVGNKSGLTSSPFSYTIEHRSSWLLKVNTPDVNTLTLELKNEPDQVGFNDSLTGVWSTEVKQ